MSKKEIKNQGQQQEAVFTPQTYCVKGLMEMQLVLHGSSPAVDPVVVRFEGGQISGYGIAPARFITDDPETIAALRSELAQEKIDRFLSEMKKLGYDRREVVTLLEKEEMI